MRRVRAMAAACAAAAIWTGPAGAAVLRLDFAVETGGAPATATASFRLDFGFGADVTDASAGLSVLALNFALDSPAVYSWRAATGTLILGGAANLGDQVAIGSNDFAFHATDLFGSPEFPTAILSQAGQGLLPIRLARSLTVSEERVPLPAPAGLLAAALGLLALVRRGRDRPGPAPAR